MYKYRVVHCELNDFRITTRGYNVYLFIQGDSLWRFQIYISNTLREELCIFCLWNCTSNSQFVRRSGKANNWETTICVWFESLFSFRLFFQPWLIKQPFHAVYSIGSFHSQYTNYNTKRRRKSQCDKTVPTVVSAACIKRFFKNKSCKIYFWFS